MTDSETEETFIKALKNVSDYDNSWLWFYGAGAFMTVMSLVFLTVGTNGQCDPAGELSIILIMFAFFSQWGSPESQANLLRTEDRLGHGYVIETARLGGKHPLAILA